MRFFNTVMENICPKAKSCGGCQLQNMPYPEQLDFKMKKMNKLLGKFCDISPIIGMHYPFNYRKKVQSAFFRGRGGKILSGVFQSNSRNIVPVDDCMIQSKTANKITKTMARLIKKYGIEPFDLRSGSGNLRHLLVREGAKSSQVLVVIVTATPILPNKKHFVSELVSIHPEITSVVHNVNKNYDGLMLGDFETVLYGPGYIEDTLCGVKFRISPRAFYQVNPQQAEKLYKKAIEYAEIKETDSVIDAYCGVGTISLIAAKNAKTVYGVELNRDAVRDARTNAKLNGIKNAEFVTADAGEWMLTLAQMGKTPNVLIVDPPRSGLSDDFIEALLTLRPERVVYVSCSPESLARDLKKITEVYTAEEITPVDMFPFTSHVECVVRLCRNEHSSI